MQIERHALADGALLDTYRVFDPGAAWLAYDTDLYFTTPPGMEFHGECPFLFGLNRLRLSDGVATSIDQNALTDRVLIDGDVLYYTRTIIPCSPGPPGGKPVFGPPASDARCYRLR